MRLALTRHRATRRPSWRAAFEVASWRYGWAWSATAIVLVAAALIAFVATPSLDAALMRLEAQRQTALVSNAPTPAVPAVTGLGEQIALIETYVQRQGSFESQLRRVVDIAARHGITLKRGDYSTVSDKASGVERVQLSLSVAARYPQFRAFMEEVLRDSPTLSLDQFALKRDKVEQAQIEVVVKLSFWTVRRAPVVEREPAAARRATS